jgi:hypothetical protein
MPPCCYAEVQNDSMSQFGHLCHSFRLAAIARKLRQHPIEEALLALIVPLLPRQRVSDTCPKKLAPALDLFKS